MHFTQLKRLPATISLPALFPSSGHRFAADGYDLTQGFGIGTNIGTLDANVITFPGEFGPVTLGTDNYVFVLTMD